MTLNQYLALANLTSKDFARLVKVSVHAVRKWRQKQRMPRPGMVNKIIRVTKGQVKYEDWYPE